MYIMTSYFGSKAPRSRKVCIAKWHRNWIGARAPIFAPSNPKAEDWVMAYRADLEARFPAPEKLRRVLEEIYTITPSPILCCYEAKAEECHRSVLAAFIWEKLGIVVKEWEPEAQSPRQGFLL